MKTSISTPIVIHVPVDLRSDLEELARKREVSSSGERVSLSSLVRTAIREMIAREQQKAGG